MDKPKSKIKRKLEDDKVPKKKIKIDIQDSVKEEKSSSTTINKSAISSSKREKLFDQIKPSWDVAEVLSETFNTDISYCQNFTSLLQNDCTLPFIARYRKECVGNLDSEVLRKMKTSYDELQKVEGKIISVVETLQKQNQLTESLKQSICSAKMIEEIEHWYAPFKSSKRRLADRAKEIGLEDTAIKLLNSSEISSMVHLVKPSIEGLETIKEVEKGIQHIIADIMAKDNSNRTYINSVVEQSDVLLQATKSRSAGKLDPEAAKKFENYFEFSSKIKHVKPHQVLALNRGEEQKILSVKICLPKVVETSWNRFCYEKYLNGGTSSNPLRHHTIKQSIEEAYNRFVEPLIIRRTRAKLTQSAHQASIEVFATNLKHLLLTPPLRNTCVLGLDPGFKNGCKCAVVSSNGSVLHTETIYINFKSSFGNQSATKSLINMVATYECGTIALGNGTACRETESFLTSLIQKNAFQPIDVRYTIINEAGASIYSCTAEAKEEFPYLDPNLISAVSIARRLQDPLTEYIRVAAPHLGIGMYQHDISPKKLEASLDEVVIECVSFVGVDLGSCPLHVLSKVAGLSETKAKKIIEYRSKNGPFVCREQLMDVKLIGAKTFEQCAGFLRIYNQDRPARSSKKVTSSKVKSKSFHPNPLDRTSVHPESYELAERLIQLTRADANEIGHQSFVSIIKDFRKGTDVKELVKVLGGTESQLEQIIDSLTETSEYDMRAKFEKPLFKKGITTLADINVGDVLTGQVNNVTHFGAFVDIGIGRDSLLHISDMKISKNDINIGKRVSVRIKSINLAREHVGLQLINIL